MTFTVQCRSRLHRSPAQKEIHSTYSEPVGRMDKDELMKVQVAFARVVHHCVTMVQHLKALHRAVDKEGSRSSHPTCIVGCANLADGHGVDFSLGIAKVGELQQPGISIQQRILQLDVPMQHACTSEAGRVSEQLRDRQPRALRNQPAGLL